jgi:large subunit ribosomal protein L21
MNIAVIKTGGKQYLVKENSIITIEKMADVKKDDVITFDSILLTDDGSEASLGSPSVSGAKVKGTVLALGRAPKVVVVKYKAKSRYYKKRGHKQPNMKVKISKF